MHLERNICSWHFIKKQKEKSPEGDFSFIILQD